MTATSISFLGEFCVNVGPCRVSKLGRTEFGGRCRPFEDAAWNVRYAQRNTPNDSARRISLRGKKNARHVAPIHLRQPRIHVFRRACPITLGFPFSFRIPSALRIGAVNIVVTKAMITIMVKSVGVKTPTL